jgi:TrmH family RNA methyltransferase
VAATLGDHSRKLSELRSAVQPKGRRGAAHFVFEGPTLLEEAHRSGLTIEEIYATQRAYGGSPLARRLEEQGIPVWLVSERAAARLSDVENPTGVLAVAPRRLAGIGDVLSGPGAVLVLADLADPGNAGTLVRCAEAFAASGVIFGRRGVDPYHPKVVRAAMGSLFRVPVAVATPEALAPLLGTRPVLGLEAGGAPLGAIAARSVLVVGQERKGLGPWRGLCTSLAGIPIAAGADSLNAAVAGAIALYEASRRPPR